MHALIASLNYEFLKLFSAAMSFYGDGKIRTRVINSINGLL